MALSFPDIDPVLISIGPFAIRWYALAYIAGVLLGAQYVKRLNQTPPTLQGLKPFDDLMVHAILGIILGGRLGYILFYQFDYYLAYPAAMLKVWEGGMSFHGGLTGFVLAVLWFSRKQRYSFLHVMDYCAAAAPLGICFGRLANFINAELYGRAGDVAWAIIFPTDPEQLPRHPSQLYEAALEGVVLFTVLWLLVKHTSIRQYRGMLSGAFLIGYALARIVVECFRQPDIQLGFLWGGSTMGQLLSLPLLALGIGVIAYAKKQGKLHAA